ncbi:FapA family protein [Salidesulfovibrio brasiliensis]
MAQDDKNTCDPMNEPEKQKGSADARFRFCLSDDSMKLGISRYIPPTQLGAKPTVDSLCRQIEAAGVKLPPDRAAAKRVIGIINNGGGSEEVSGITLVRGIEVQEPQDATIEPKGDLSWPVFPGDRFAEYSPPKEAREGQTIDGKITKPRDKSKPSDLKPEAGSNCDFDATTGLFVSSVYGLARIEGGRVSVDPAIWVTTDEIRVIGNLHSKDFRGGAVTPDRIVKILYDMKVALEPDLDWLDKELMRAANSGEPAMGKVIVKGRPPKDGRDGWLEYLVTTREESGTEDDQGRIDYRNRGQYPSVDQGQVIARLHPPTQGEAGMDVYGKTIPANAGNEMVLHAGENVEVAEDGITFSATGSGIMVVERGVLSVTQCLVIAGDVDMSTGNVRVEEGSVKINGNVLGGFKVEAPEHIVVGGTVESADLKAGGNIDVKGGILQPDGGMVEAGGDITTGFSANATIRAGKSFFVKNECSNCRIHAPVVIAAKGKGVVQGGTISITEGMEVNELGSELGVPTKVVVGVGRKEDAEVLEERSRLKKELQKIDRALGSSDPKQVLMRTPEAKREQVAKIIKHRMGIAKNYEESAARATAIVRKRQEDLASVKIRVKKTIFAGVTIKMGGKALKVKRNTDRSMVYWHPGKDEIEIGNL